MYSVAVGVISFSVVVCGFLLTKILFDRSPAVILNPQGLTDNSGAFSVGFIPWSRISSIEQKRFAMTKFIQVFVENPEEFLGSQSYLRRLTQRANLKMGGAPIQIATVTLNGDFDDLYSNILEYFHRYKKDGDALLRASRKD